MPQFTPQSQVRVTPQAPKVNFDAFTRAPAPDAGLRAFEQGAKLPLMLEQIKLEKVRQKAEKAKLDLAEMTANQQLQDFEALTSQQQALKAAEVTLTQAQATTAENTAKLTAPIDVGGALRGVLGAETLPVAAPVTSEVVAPQAAAPLAEATLADPIADVPPAPQTVRYEASSLPVVSNITNRTAQEARRDQVNNFITINSQFPVAAGKARGLLKEAKTFARTLKPSTTQVSWIDDNGVPLTMDVEQVGNETTRAVSDPRIDVGALSDATKKRDSVFGATIKENTPERKAAAALSLKRLIQASEELGKLEASDEWTEKIQGNRFMGLLPEKLQALFTPKKAYARDQVRQVIQAELRATLGAQFARIEGEMMMDRAFNPLFETGVNLSLIADVLRGAEAASIERGNMESYFNANETLMGYKGGVDITSSATPLADSVDAIAKQVGSPVAGAPAVIDDATAASAARGQELAAKWVSSRSKQP